MQSGPLTSTRNWSAHWRINRKGKSSHFPHRAQWPGLRPEGDPITIHLRVLQSRLNSFRQVFMSDATDAPSSSRPAPSPESIAERVAQRLALAGLAIDRRSRASRPRAGRRRSTTTPPPATSPATDDAARRRERACLRSVFRELGDAHRHYRTQTGTPGTPALREAAYAFKREPSVASLVPVAAFLDELGILAW